MHHLCGWKKWKYLSGCFVDVSSARTSCDVPLCHKLKILIVPPNQYYFPFFFFCSWLYYSDSLTIHYIITLNFPQVSELVFETHFFSIYKCISLSKKKPPIRLTCPNLEMETDLPKKQSLRQPFEGSRLSFIVFWGLQWQSTSLPLVCCEQDTSRALNLGQRECGLCQCYSWLCGL